MLLVLLGPGIVLVMANLLLCDDGSCVVSSLRMYVDDILLQVVVTMSVPFCSAVEVNSYGMSTYQDVLIFF